MRHSAPERVRYTTDEARALGARLEEEAPALDRRDLDFLRHAVDMVVASDRKSKPSALPGHVSGAIVMWEYYAHARRRDGGSAYLYRAVNFPGIEFESILYKEPFFEGSAQRETFVYRDQEFDWVEPVVALWQRDHGLPHDQTRISPYMERLLPRLHLEPGQPPPSALSRVWRPTHRHYKGGLYRVIGFARLEADGAAAVIYENEAGEKWVRPRTGFYETMADGRRRFEPLS